MVDLKYRCMKCGTCCYEIPEKSEDYPIYKRIPLYPEEVDRLVEIAKKRGVLFQVIEDLVFPDKLNQKILVVTYRIKLDNENHNCPFYQPEKGCTVQEVKPLACQSYPLALKQVDAFNFTIDIDPLCNFVINNYEELKKGDLNLIKKVFDVEYPHAQRHLEKNKKIILKLRKLEFSKKIDIFRKITLEEFNKYLKEWDRVEFKA